eukprot:scaffold72051_cov63-Phaeocystis_antarctica.AAC.1
MLNSWSRTSRGSRPIGALQCALALELDEPSLEDLGHVARVEHLGLALGLGDLELLRPEHVDHGVRRAALVGARPVQQAVIRALAQRRVGLGQPSPQALGAVHVAEAVSGEVGSVGRAVVWVEAHDAEGASQACGEYRALEQREDELVPLRPPLVPARRGEDDRGAALLPCAEHELRLRPEGAHQTREVAAPSVHAVADGGGGHALRRKPDARGRLRPGVWAEGCHGGRQGSGVGVGVALCVAAEAQGLRAHLEGQAQACAVPTHGFVRAQPPAPRPHRSGPPRAEHPRRRRALLRVHHLAAALGAGRAAPQLQLAVRARRPEDSNPARPTGRAATDSSLPRRWTRQEQVAAAGAADRLRAPGGRRARGRMGCLRALRWAANSRAAAAAPTHG